MYDVFKLFATDENKENNGVKIQLSGGASITVARAGNEMYLQRIIEESEAHIEDLKSLPKKAADVLDRKILCQVMAETILLGFEGISYNGKPMKYSKANAEKLLSHKDFRKLVMAEASKLENFKVEQEEADVKN